MSMMDLMGQAPGMGQAPPEQPFSPAPAPGSEGKEGASRIKEIIALVRDYANAEDDEENILTAEKITTMLQQILASEQKEQDGMMQGKVSPRALRKAYSSGPDA